MRHLALMLLLFFAPWARAEGGLSFPEFKALAEELAPKVNLFADAWAADPGAEFYGGTTRDYLYWLKGQLREGKTPDQLRKLPLIDVREFIIGDSDVDIVSKKDLALKPKEYGVKKIDSIDSERFNPATPKGKNELDQGYIPIEKIRLSRKGFVAWAGVGDGVLELYDGKPTVHFAAPEAFEATLYAKKKLNHPVLLALRYLRLVAMNHFREHGGGVPNQRALFSIDRASSEAVTSVLAKAAEGGSLVPYLEQERFKTWRGKARVGALPRRESESDDRGIHRRVRRRRAEVRVRHRCFRREEQPRADEGRGA